MQIFDKKIDYIEDNPNKTILLKLVYIVFVTQTAFLQTPSSNTQSSKPVSTKEPYQPPAADNDGWGADDDDDDWGDIEVVPSQQVSAWGIFIF